MLVRAAAHIVRLESTAAAPLPRRLQQLCQHHQQEAQVRPRRQRLRERRSSVSRCSLRTHLPSLGTKVMIIFSFPLAIFSA